MALFLPTDTFAYIALNGEIVRVDGTDLNDTGGPWLGSIAYQPKDVVAFQNGLFVAIAASFNQPPTAIVDMNWSSLVTTPAPFVGHSADEAYALAEAGSNLAYVVYGSLAAGGAGIPNVPQAVFCHHVNWGTGADQVNASQMPYQGAYATVQSALDALLFVPLTITSFGNTVGTVEIGQTVSVIGLSWVYNKTPVSQSIDQGIGMIPVPVYVYTDTGTFQSSRTYTLSATDGSSFLTRQTTVAFLNKCYWGASNDPAITDAEILALSYEFATSFAQSRVITASAEYVYFAFPASFGVPSFTVNGLPNTAWQVTNRVFVNASGFSNSYSIWRSVNLLTGTYTIVLS